MIQDDSSEDGDTNVSLSSIQLTQTGTEPRWTRLVTGRVIDVVEPGNREFVCSVGETNGSGY